MIEAFYHGFAPIEVREQDTIMKAKDLFLNTRKTKALLECIVQEINCSRRA